jgi:hypothetical protein
MKKTISLVPLAVIAIVASALAGFCFESKHAQELQLRNRLWQQYDSQHQHCWLTPKLPMRAVVVDGKHYIIDADGVVGEILLPEHGGQVVGHLTDRRTNGRH